MKCRTLTNVEIAGVAISAGKEIETDERTYEKLLLRNAVAPIEIDCKQEEQTTLVPSANVSYEPQRPKRFTLKRNKR